MTMTTLPWPCLGLDPVGDHYAGDLPVVVVDLGSRVGRPIRSPRHHTLPLSEEIGLLGVIDIIGFKQS
jgi:hypothetical protein